VADNRGAAVSHNKRVKMVLKRFLKISFPFHSFR
jgi:hypothetical protein